VSREELRARWKERLDLSKIRLDFAVQSLMELEEEQRAGRPLPADPSLLFEYATRAVNELRREYLRIGQVYLDLVQYEKIPDEQAWQSLNAGILANHREVTPKAAANPRSAAVILIADDDPGIRNLLQTMLEPRGYCCLLAGSGAEALGLSRSHAGEINLLISDVDMPEMGGVSLAKQIAAERSEIRVLLISGRDSDEIRAAKLPFLRKPFVPQELWHRVEVLLSGPVAADDDPD
jgi:CheY-like chemotaxis protein